MSQFFASGGQSIGVSASTSVLPMNIWDWFPEYWYSNFEYQIFIFLGIECPWMLIFQWILRIDWFDLLAVQGLIHVKSQYLTQHQQLCQSESLNLLILATVLNLQIARIMISVVVHLLCCIWAFATPRTAENQASLSFTISQSLLRLMSIESVMPSSHLILCRPLLLSPSIFPGIGVFSNESALHTRWPKYWSFRFSTSPSNEHSGLIFFRIG